MTSKRNKDGDIREFVKIVEFPFAALGLVIGKDGANINKVKTLTGTRISLDKKNPVSRAEVRGSSALECTAACKAISNLAKKRGLCGLIHGQERAQMPSK
jgi:transcription antitermination factor NusA-like protein